MRRHLALLAAGAALASPSSALSRADVAAVPARPNVVFVLADDLGYAELGSYGQQKIRTPSLDRLAAEGVRFTQHYSGNAVCAPSRSVLLTGRHPGRTPIRDNREVQPEGQAPLPGAAVTLAELFKKEGYVTGAMGKWGLGPPGSEGDPLRQGFDRFFGYNCQRQAHNFYPAYLYDDERRLPLDNPPFPAHQKLPDGSDPDDPRSYAGYARPGLRARPHLGASACVRPRQPGPSLLPLSPDHRARTSRFRCRRTRWPSTAGVGPTRRTAAATATSRTPRRAPPTPRWSPAWTARSGGSSTSSASWVSTSGRSSCSPRTTARPTTASAARTRSSSAPPARSAASRARSTRAASACPRS